MIEQMAQTARPVLEWGIVRRVRRNHGLEHATIHMLTRRQRVLRIAGRADNRGFFLYGETDTDTVREAAEEALARMKRGEAKWAVHPNCGTGLVVSSAMTSGAALLGLAGVEGDRPAQFFARLPMVMFLTVVALLASRPAGLSIQRHITTSGMPGDLEIAQVIRREVTIPMGGTLTVHRILTRNG
ncbi:MAG: DUF6391 domain-containing protein [Anaerolineales bacterium]